MVPGIQCGASERPSGRTSMLMSAEGVDGFGGLPRSVPSDALAGLLNKVQTGLEHLVIPLTAVHALLVWC